MPADHGPGRASHRRSYNRGYQAQRRAGLRAAGLCVQCGREPAKPGRNGAPGCRCEACAAKANAKSKANLARRRPAWKALGICVVCGCREAIRGQCWCGVCSERCVDHHARAREMRP